MQDTLSGLNPEQIRAVKQIKGPVLVLAGAGSGKTKTLTHRIAYLIKEKRVSPESILTITFTNKAAGEIKDRIKRTLRLKSDKRFNISTFHSLCAKLLRREADKLGYNRSFSIFDASDQLTTVKQAMERLNLDTKKFAPEAILHHIGSAKNELLDGRAYSEIATGSFQKVVARVYFVYQEILRRNQAMDFDDLIMNLVTIFKDEPAVLKKYQDQFQYILIDEYQDTNTAQYELAKLLAHNHRNLFVVGDDWQCVVPGTVVETKKGSKKIEDIAKGELVRSASGYGKTAYFEVLHQKKFHYSGQLINIKTASGKILTCTPNHLLFARWVNSDAYFVYLMYSKTMGYRIGTVKGTRFDGKKHDIGLRVRANQERADRMWVIKVCDNRTEAMYTEALLAYKYGIPMMVFYAASNRSMQLEQKHINSLYREIDTKTRAKSLMEDIGLLFDYPHFSPQATIRGNTKRHNINLVLLGNKRVTHRSPWSASRISSITTHRDSLSFFQKMGYTIRAGRRNTYRAEIHDLDYGKLEQVLDKLRDDISAIQINRYAFLTDKKFLFMPASQIHPGMVIPVARANQITEDQVAEITQASYFGPVYDLDIDKVHNYIASHLVVHNSIYSWRGANFRNILNFHKDYADARIFKLEQNYRSTQNILDAGHIIMANNKSKSEKQLWTKQGEGDPIIVYEALNEQDESDFIIKEIEKLRAEADASLNDFVVLYRTNAQSRSLEEGCLRHGLPYQIVGGVRFYDRKEIKDMLAHLMLLVNSNDNIALQRIINIPARGIGKKTWLGFEAAAMARDQSVYAYLLAMTNPTPALKDFIKIMQKIKRRSPSLVLSKLLDYILLQTGYKTMLTSEGIEGETRLENIFELKSVMEKYDHLAPTRAIAVFLEEVSLIANIDTYTAGEEAITLMTLHSSKGLEFDYVFIAGMEENLFPHSRALFEPAELEEERRLCYVGITRAKRRVYLIHTAERLWYGTLQNNPLSRFIEDLPEDLIETIRRSTQHTRIGSRRHKPQTIEPGAKIVHQKFGAGTVISQTGDVLTIAFVKAGIKNLAAGIADIKVKP